MRDDWHWEFFTNPSLFLDVARDHLRRNAVEASVLATVAQRAVEEERELALLPGAPYWWAVVRDGVGGPVLGLSMRASNLVGRPLYMSSVPHGAGLALARRLVERAEEIVAVNGALPGARECLQGYAAMTGGGQVVVEVASRLHELGDLTILEASQGAPRLAQERDLDLVLGWFAAFERDADEQAGRPVGTHSIDVDPTAIRDRLKRALVLLWTVDDVPVHLSGFTKPAFGVVRIGPVYTPPQHRGRGYAGAAVSLIARTQRDAGARVCLFTDQANPVSNALYARIGFAPVVDMANHTLRSRS